MTMRDPNIPKDKVAARQGTKQKMNMRVLATSLALIALIFAGLYMLFLAAPHSQNEAREPTPAPSQSTQPSPPIVPPAQPQTAP